MRILAIDTALPAVSVCVLDENAGEPVAMESLAMEKGHAEALLPMIERVMAGVDGGFASLDRVAATVGPGSFTGIRIGVAAARGIALARGLETVGVSTLAAFAAPLLTQESDSIVAAAIAPGRPDRSCPWYASARGAAAAAARAQPTIE